MTKLLITGASGFIGSYFINAYQDKYSIQAFSFLHDEIESLHVKGVDAVLHLSALVHQMGGASDEEYERVNVAQTLHLAQKAKASGVKQFVFMSTVKVYGEESDEVYTKCSTCRPQDAYGRSKHRAEEELLKLEDENFKISIIRTPIVYGAGVKANIQSLTRLIQKLPILPFGGIHNKRSFVYVGNLCHLVNEVLLQQKSGIFLCADDAPLSTTRLCELIAQGLGKKVWLIKIPFFETIVKKLKTAMHRRLYGNLEVDNTTTKNTLNLKNPYSTEEGIKLMLKSESKKAN
jgi:UDP-glucose 4-epimerase